MKTSDFLKELTKSLETDAYDFGTYIHFDELDVQNLKHPFFDKLK